MDDKKPKRDYSYLKKYQFGQGINKPGKPKGTRDKKTALTLELLEEALLIDPQTGKRMSAKRLKQMLSKQVWSANNKILLDVLNRKLGKVPDRLDQTQRIIFTLDAPEQKQLSDDTDKETVIDGEIVQYELEEQKEE